MVALLLGMPVRAQLATPTVCEDLARHITADFAPSPLKALAAKDADFLRLTEAEQSSADLAQAMRDIVARDPTATLEVKEAVRDPTNPMAISFPRSGVSVIDLVSGTLYCHTLFGLAGLPSGAAHRIPLTVDPDCAKDVVGATIGGTDALIVDDERWFTQDQTRSTLTISSLDREQFAPPCQIAIEYRVAFHVADAFCQGVDCVAVGRKAEALVASRESGTDADALGAEAVPTGTGQMDSEYRRLAALAAREGLDPELPTFGATISGYTRFDEAILFPLSLDDGHVYLARLGHGSLGWRHTPDYLFAVYTLAGGSMRPVAGIHLGAERTEIALVQAK